jgi:Ca2+-binding RTX toxin-like protein
VSPVRLAIKALFAAALVAAIVPASASAITVRGASPYFNLADLAGVQNSVVISVPAPGQIRIADTAGVNTEFPGGCTVESAQSLVCPTSTISSNQIYLGAGDDSYLQLDHLPLSPNVYGEDGNDTLTTPGLGAPTGQVTEDVLFGGPGNDVLSGGDGEDQLSGGIGDDLCLGGIEDDICFASRGNDSCEMDGGDDVCFLRAGRDSCSMGAGADDCIGGDGRDRCNGGGGRKDKVSDCERTRGFEIQER